MDDAIKFVSTTIEGDIKLKAPTRIPGGAICAMSGESITEGYPMHDVMTAATGSPLDLVHGQTDGFMSVSVAKTFKLMRNVGGLIVFEDGIYYKPLISTKSATSDRPTWTQLVRSIWPERRGQRAVILLSTDFKKRVWQNLRVSTIGHASMIYVYDTSRNVAANQVVNWQHLIETLDLVEEIYKAGYSKRAIETSLMSDYASFCRDMAYALEKERMLQLIRNKPEFLVSCIIAQKE